MKKLILVLTISIGLVSCAYQTPIDILVVYSIEPYRDGNCFYVGNDNKRSNVNLFSHESSCIIDTCGKYNIGDTIVFKKK